MNEKALNTLEYNIIVNKLVDLTRSSLGKKISRSIEPSTDINEVQSFLNETEEATSLIFSFGYPSIYEIHDFKLPLNHVGKGGILSPRELLDAATILRSTKEVKRYLSDNEDNKRKFPNIAELIYDLVENNPIESEISTAIISDNEISDNASRELKRIRKEIIIKTNSIREKLNNILRSSNSQKLLQDSFVTMRDGRYVIPVKSENRHLVKGIIHDQSSSGSTSFIEPMVVVEINNEIKILEAKEEQEIKRILKELSMKLYEIKNDIINNQEILSRLDFIFAKGNLAIELNCSKPILNDKGYIDLKNARHPLLNKNTVVPIDIYLGKDYNTLVITGPNTGGKTVTLKTLGLLTLMAQSGLMIPSNNGSTIAIFNEIFADIGDEQSIEQSLSTFSSHMINIVNILNNLKYNSLVLFDELGAGTDPTEGAALAISILEKLLKKNIRTVATTHYSQLKLFALNTEGVKNGSVEFDINTLRPTYRLNIGVPGKSNAFEISKRLGLEDSIIIEARKLISEENKSFEDILAKIDYERKETEKSKERQNFLEAEARTLKERLEKEILKTEDAKNKIIEDAKEEAYNIIKDAKDSSSELIKELKFLQNNINDNISQKAVKIENELNEKIYNNKPKENILKTTDINSHKQIGIGDEVEILGMDEIGEVITNPNKKGDLQVQVGIIKVNANIKNLKKVIKSDKENISNNIKNIIRNKINENINKELDLRGYNIEEAIYLIEKFIDDAYIVGIKEIMLIHGKGTGVLRKGIQSYLNRNKYIRSFRVGSYSEGGTGVTVVELK